jgi:hypothetical protein
MVAAFASWHAAHDAARIELGRRPSAVFHCLVETYSVLTRLPEPQRADPDLVAEFFDRNFSGRPLTLDPDRLRSVPNTLATLGVSGGAAYDGLVALTALAHGARLVSLDRRAEATYRRCGLEFELLV